MQCTNSYGHNKEPCWLLYITIFHCQNMKKRPIENKGILSSLHFYEEVGIVYHVGLKLFNGSFKLLL